MVFLFLTYTYAVANSYNSYKHKYVTKKEYILDNFQLSIEFSTGIPVMKLGDKNFYYPFYGGILVGYYLCKYLHEPPERHTLQPYYTYNFITRKREINYPDIGISVKGEGSLLLEIGIKLPQQERYKPSLDSNFEIREKYIFSPITIKWTTPIIPIFSLPMFSYLKFGGTLKYLLTSNYVAGNTDKDLPLGKPGDVINLKTYLKDLRSLSYGIILEFGALLDIGLNISCVVMVPEEFFSSLFSPHSNIPKDNEHITVDYVKQVRAWRGNDHLFGINIGLDCFTFYKKIKKYKNLSSQKTLKIH